MRSARAERQRLHPRHQHQQRQQPAGRLIYGPQQHVIALRSGAAGQALDEAKQKEMHKQGKTDADGKADQRAPVRMADGPISMAESDLKVRRLHGRLKEPGGDKVPRRVLLPPRQPPLSSPTAASRSNR